MSMYMYMYRYIYRYPDIYIYMYTHSRLQNPQTTEHGHRMFCATVRFLFSGFGFEQPCSNFLALL